MALGEERLHSILESILLIAPEPVPLLRIIEVIKIEDPRTDEEAIKKAVQSLLALYESADRVTAQGFRVIEVGQGLQLRTVPENAQYVRRFLAAKPQRLTKAALETLSIIAYRQPVTKPEIESIRGVDVGAAIKGLLDRDFIKILGKRDEVGRPLIYGTTPQFLEFFGMRGLAELPTLREYHELDDEHQREVDALDEERKPKISDLAKAAQFMVEREDDPDLDALDRAVQDADRVRRVTDQALHKKEEPPENALPPESAPDGSAPAQESAAGTDAGAAAEPSVSPSEPA